MSSPPFFVFQLNNFLKNKWTFSGFLSSKEKLEGPSRQNTAEIQLSQESVSYEKDS